MPKTIFQSGTIVSAEFLNSIYNTDNGHEHDGGDSDGSVDKINLTTEVVGRLPAANLGDHAHDGSDISKINPVNHVLGAEEGGFVVNSWSGFSDYQAISVSWKVSGQTTVNPKTVTLSFPPLLADSNSQVLGTAIDEMPAALRPITGDVYMPIIVTSGGMRKSGFINIDADGSIEFFCGDNAMGFANSGVKGFDSFAVTYPIYPAS